MRTSGSATSPRSRSVTIDAVSSWPAMNSSAITRSSYFAASSYAGMKSAATRTVVSPIVDPSRAGLMTTGRPRCSATLVQSVAFFTIAKRGVGIPEASHTSLVRHLSIASAEPITPLPVYGMRSVSSAPCTVPSSPKRPCSAMKTRAKPSRFRSKRSRCAGSNACASTRLPRSAASTALPEMSEISRSAEGPPISTATLPTESLKLFPDNPHFTGELDPGLREHRRAHVVHHRFDVRRRRISQVHDEVGVLRRDLRAADREALQSARLDQPRRVVSRRVAEDAAGVGLVQRLRGHALGKQRADAPHRAVFLAGLEPEESRDETLLGARLQMHVPIPQVVFGGHAAVQRAGAIDGLHRHHVVPRLAAVAAGIHRERPAHRSGNACHPLGAGPAVPGDEAREMRRRNARAGAKRELDALRFVLRDSREGVMREDHGTRGSPVRHQQVAAEPHDKARLRRGERAHEHAEVGQVRGLEEASRGPAGAPCHVPGHRLVVADLSPQLVSHRRSIAHVHVLQLPVAFAAPPAGMARSGARLAIDPAPIVTTTSPPRSRESRAARISEVRSTNTGSPRPVSRPAPT